MMLDFIIGAMAVILVIDVLDIFIDIYPAKYRELCNRGSRKLFPRDYL